MPTGLDRTDLNSTGTSFKDGIPVPPVSDNDIVEPKNFGNPITQVPDPTMFGNEVTWAPSTDHFGNLFP